MCLCLEGQGFRNHPEDLLVVAFECKAIPVSGGEQCGGSGGEGGVAAGVL